MTQTLTRRIMKWPVRLVAVLATVLATIVVGYAVQTRMSLPDLAAWHRLALSEEFHAGHKDVHSFEDYLQLEDRLFAELRSRLLDDPQAVDRFALGRYRPGSVPAQLALDTRYNQAW